MDQQLAVWVQPPPRQVLQVVNPIMRRLLVSTLASRLPAAMAVLEFNGRRSGRRFAVPVGVHNVRDDLVVFSEAGWRRNFAGGQEVTVRRGRQRRRGRALLIEDPVEVATVLSVAVERIGARNLAMRTPPGHEITHEDLLRLGRGMIRLDLDAGP